MIKYRKYLLKLKDAFLEENVQNTKMLDLYLKYLEGEASEQDLEAANKQLTEILKSLGMGVLVVLPFSPVSIPYLVKKGEVLTSYWRDISNIKCDYPVDIPCPIKTDIEFCKIYGNRFIDMRTKQLI